LPNWSELLIEIGRLGSPFDILRRKYVADLADYTNRNVICYYSGWLQKPELGDVTIVNDVDKNGLMTTINGLDVSKGLDLVLHTPGGETAATESIVDYLWSKFGGDIRCFVPQMAMSAGTMIACSCREIWMGRQSSLGPIDPQFNTNFGNIPAHGVIEEFERAIREVQANPATAPIWQAVVAKYPPAFLGECQKAIDWSTSLADSWLRRNMLAGLTDQEERVGSILRELVDHSVNLAHNRHLSAEKCKEIGLKVMDLEADQRLQNLVLSVHHIYFHTLSGTGAFKIIENQNGMAFILQAQQVRGAGGQSHQQVAVPPTESQPPEVQPQPTAQARTAA